MYVVQTNRRLIDLRIDRPICTALGRQAELVCVFICIHNAFLNTETKIKSKNINQRCGALLCG